MMGPPNRAPSRLPVTAVKSYVVLSPLATHYRVVTCAEADCTAHAKGWVTRVDERTELGAKQAGYIRASCVVDSATLRPDVLGGRRRYTVAPGPDGTTDFTFPAGQECFAEHHAPLERPELYVVRDGDHRGNPTGRVREHAGPADWTEDFAEHQQALSDAQERG